MSLCWYWNGEEVCVDVPVLVLEWGGGMYGCSSGELVLEWGGGNQHESMSLTS